MEGEVWLNVCKSEEASRVEKWNGSNGNFHCKMEVSNVEWTFAILCRIAMDGPYGLLYLSNSVNSICTACRPGTTKITNKIVDKEEIQRAINNSLCDEKSNTTVSH